MTLYRIYSSYTYIYVQSMYNVHYIFLYSLINSIFYHDKIQNNKLTFSSILETTSSTAFSADFAMAAAACSFLDIWPRKDAWIFVAASQSSINQRERERKLLLDSMSINEFQIRTLCRILSNWKKNKISSFKIFVTVTI